MPKNERWWKTSIAVAFALLILSPYLLATVSRGVVRTVDAYGSIRADGLQAITLWLSIVSNNQVGLLLLSVAGLALGALKQKIQVRPFLLLPLVFLATLGLFAEFTLIVYMLGIRYQLAGLLLFVLFQVAGLHALFAIRKVLGLLVVLWALAGLVFQYTGNWTALLSSGRLTPFELPAYHAVSRLATQLGTRPHIVGLPYHPRMLDYGKSMFTNEEYYFDRHGIHFELIHSSGAQAVSDHLQQGARFEPVIWLFYQTSKVDSVRIADLEKVIESLHYRLCDIVELGIDTVIRQYAWVSFGCETAESAASHRTQLLSYEFYGAKLDAAEYRLYFSDAWTGALPFQPQDYQMSYQLISQNWEKVAQLDLPLVDPGESRIFYIDVADVPAGVYRLMAILYDRHTGERIDWHDNGGFSPDMLALAEVVLR